MAGKSTILRSTAAATLLSLCGLMVPATSARVPGIDGIELRTFHGDAPAEGKSAWSMEMHEMQCVPAKEIYDGLCHSMWQGRWGWWGICEG